jgi:hypothetical protein
MRNRVRGWSLTTKRAVLPIALSRHIFLTMRTSMRHLQIPLSWQEAAMAFHTSWQGVFRSVRHVVFRGAIHREWGTITAIGIDEIA